MTPRIAQAIVIAVAALAVLVAAIGRGGSETRGEEQELVLRYLYSTDAEELVVPLIERFNRESHRLGGREVRIDGFKMNSGEAEAALAAGDERAHLWTPASSLWGRLLNHSVSEEWVPAEKPDSLVWSTQVIAMWEPLARALGWPTAKVGWGDILDLATGKRSWADYGHPEYGPFLLGHTNPGISTSGLSAVASDYYAVTDKRSGLTLADVQQRDVRAAVRKIERLIVHYGETADELLKEMARHREAYAHAVYVQETNLRKLNEKRSQANQLVGIRPADGTFVADYPLIALDAPWVSANERAASQEFRRWLVPKITTKNAAKSGFDTARPTGLVELQPPKGDVLTAIRDAWHEDRPPANIVLVADTSGSMSQEGRLEAAKKGVLSFLGELSREDWVALITSGDSIERKVRLGPPNRSVPAVTRAVGRLFYPAVSLAFDDLHALHDPDRINAVVVLSDGTDTRVGLKELLSKIKAESVTEGTSVRIFTVAYAGGANAEVLEQIATLSGGKFFEGSPKDIKDVYRKILSYF
jgi:Ca-activated chloride channel family protein